ncbi:hypothetical protein EC968_002277 [Mortierella alpina]|nr:hypothetical protein EC968_002277 [Mortierella alpina]
MTRFLSLAILAVSLVSVIASPLVTSPESMDVTKDSLSSDNASDDGFELALAHHTEPRSVNLGWESMRAQPKSPAAHAVLEKRGRRPSKGHRNDNKKGKEHRQKKGKKNEKKKERKHKRRPDNRSEDKTFHGRGTWFNDRFGSCGVKFSQSDLIVALNEEQMGGSGKSKRCGQRIRVTAKGSNASVVVRVVDTCPKTSCKFGMLDLSRTAFRKFAPESKGVLDLSWSFI